MVTRRRLNKFIVKRCHEIRHQVREYCAIHDPEALHILRVEIKKLRACLRLLQSCTHQRHLDAKGLKTVFKTAGEIRTAHINLKILQDLKLDNRAFVLEQEKIIEETSTLFCKEAQQYKHRINAVQHDLEASTQDIKPEKVKSFIKGRITKLSLFFSAGTFDTAGLHNARKETKELLYIHALLPATLAASLSVNTDYIDQLQHKIGNWHDNTTTQALLQSFGKADPALLRELQSAGTTQLEEIKTLTAGFDQNINTSADTTVKSGLCTGRKDPEDPGPSC